MASLDGGPITRLGLKGIRPLAVLDGALVYVQADGAVMAVPLDASGAGGRATGAGARPGAGGSQQRQFGGVRVARRRAGHRSRGAAVTADVGWP